jgi:undecaprenyl pyrophosphate phosphatase UppP
VDKRHTENQQTNNCGQTPHWLCPQLFVSWFTVWPLSTVVCLLVFCVTFVHSCLSVDFLCGVCPQLFLCWFSVWRLSTVVCLLVFCVAFVHSCLSVDLLYDLCPQLFFYWFSVWRLSRETTDKQLRTNVTKTKRQTTVDKRHTENQ